ncbi:MAG: hypothetical protein JWR09_4699 [Mucilaginibacter sp.]|nr:hypothetical protein [Mucilaginibacter sp.]
MEKSMETQIITDSSGKPLRVIMDYQEYAELLGELKRPLPKVAKVEERNPLDWYSLTESAKSIINGLVALASRERRKELNKETPDQERIAELTRIGDEAREISKKSANFQSMERMEEIIAKYSPILLAEKKKIP